MLDYFARAFPDASNSFAAPYRVTVIKLEFNITPLLLCIPISGF